jgi:ligand-binding sensor domain-containing protein
LSKNIKKVKFFLLLFLFTLNTLEQNTIALPHVINYNKQTYGGGLQNWKVRQDKNGLIYVANNEGLLTCDGTFWNLYPLPNKTIMRSLEIGDDGRIYTGGQDEIGYFQAGASGRLEYHSLLDLLPAKSRVFGDVWEIVLYDKEVFFRCSYHIFRLAGGKVTDCAPESNWQFLGKCNGKLYAESSESGLRVWEGNNWLPAISNSSLLIHDPITGMIPLANGGALVATLKSGLFTFKGTELSSSGFSNEETFKKERIYAAASLDTNRIVLATSNAGIFVIDTSGNIIQSISAAEGLQNDNVLSVLPDREGNIWLGLDNGIDFITYNNAVKQINPLYQNSSGYAAIVFEKHLYIGTANGLYSTALQDMADLSFSRGHFEQIANTTGQTWGLANINNHLLLGHHEGAFEIKNNTAVHVTGNSGFWNFSSYGSSPEAPQMLAGTYNGLQIFSVASNGFTPVSSIPDFSESSRYVATDSDNNIWVSHPYHGIYKIAPRAGGGYSIQKFTEKEGLPSMLNNHIFKIRNEIVAATTKGIYVLNSAKNHFEQSAYFNKILGSQSIRYLKESPAGNIWFIHDKSLGVIDMTGKKPFIIPFPALTNKMLSGFEFIYPLNESNIFLSGEKGFYHINYEKFKKNIPSLVVQIRSVRILDKTDSLLFGGYFAPVNEQQVQSKQIPSLADHWKTIHFDFSAVSFGNQSDLEYAYRLTGFEDKWSEWGKRTDKEYTNLNAGNYSFDVKVRNSINMESAEAHYQFKILPPWYLTRLAALLYMLILAAGLYLIYKWLKRKFRLQRQKYEAEQKKLRYIHDLEQSKIKNELVALQNEKLEADISFKNAELAASAMNLVKKGELLTKIKKDLAHVSKEIRNPEALTVINKMVKTVGDDDNLDKEWEQFAKHFDSVHSDFIVSLKEKHPTLTGNELKLCANLRMNLSTKEIAQLMNISVRGVEIGRYRLRKKLQLEAGMNLFDYLMTI